MRDTIGETCESMLHDEMMERLNRAIAARPNAVGIERAQAALRAVPVADRATWLSTQAGQDQIEDVEFERRIARGTHDADDAEVSRFFHPPEIKEPRDLRRDIRAVVRGIFERLFDVSISDRQVRLYWSRYCRSKRDV